MPSLPLRHRAPLPKRVKLPVRFPVVEIPARAPVVLVRKVNLNLFPSDPQMENEFRITFGRGNVTDCGAILRKQLDTFMRQQASGQDEVESPAAAEASSSSSGN